MLVSKGNLSILLIKCPDQLRVWIGLGWTSNSTRPEPRGRRSDGDIESISSEIMVIDGRVGADPTVDLIWLEINRETLWISMMFNRFHGLVSKSTNILILERYPRMNILLSWTCERLPWTKLFAYSRYTLGPAAFTQLCQALWCYLRKRNLVQSPTSLSLVQTPWHPYQHGAWEYGLRSKKKNKLAKKEKTKPCAKHARQRVPAYK